MVLKEVNVASLRFQPFGERAKVKFTQLLDDPEDLRALQEVNPRYINCCIFQQEGRNYVDFYFGDAVKHDIWRSLLESERGSCIHDDYSPVQLWMNDDGKIERLDIPMGINGTDDKSEKQVIKNLFKAIKPDFLTSPSVQVSFGILNKTIVYRYIPALNQLVKARQD